MCKLDPKNIKPFQEQYTTFKSPVSKGILFQYDYRASTNELFSCVGKTLATCVEKRDLWLVVKGIEA